MKHYDSMLNYVYDCMLNYDCMPNLKWNSTKFNLSFSVYIQYHFQKQMVQHLKRVSNSTVWYGNLAQGSQADYL